MQLTEKDLLPGTVVQHFKRGMLPESERADSAMYLYEILGVAHHTETRRNAGGVPCALRRAQDMRPPA